MFSMHLQDLPYETSEHSQILSFQLEALNRAWVRAASEIPYYKTIARDIGARSGFNSIREYIKSVPKLTRTIIQTRMPSISYSPKWGDYERITGGSTGQPVQVPSWRSERSRSSADLWLGRSWVGIERSSRLFLYWGHGHLLGRGPRRIANLLIRNVKDCFRNYVRHPSSDLSYSALLKAGDRLLRSRPEYVVGYSGSLDRLARENMFRKNEFRNLGVRCIIATAESFPFEDSVSVVSELFDAPCYMEYGSSETNLLAHSFTSTEMRVFWKSYLIEASNRPDIQDVLVTSLYPRRTPLFRYQLGDLFSLGDVTVAGGCSVVKIRKVLGRSDLPLVLPTGRTLHASASRSILKSHADITGFQYECRGNGIVLSLIAREGRSVGARLVDEIIRGACQIDPEFGNCLTVRQVETLHQTVAGKTPVVIHSRSEAG